MAAESEADRLAFLDVDDFGSTATINGASVAGILDTSYIDIDLGDGPGAAASAPIFSCRTSDVPAVVIGQALTIGAASYSVVDVRPDGEGMTDLALNDA